MSSITSMNVAHTFGIARAIRIALTAGRALGEGEDAEAAIIKGKRASNEEFGDYDTDTTDGRFFDDIEESVCEFIRMTEAERRLDGNGDGPCPLNTQGGKAHGAGDLGE